MMELKDIAILIVFIVFTVPGLIGITFWAVNTASNPSPENIQAGVEKTAESAIPWWLGVLNWLAGLPGLIGGLLVIAFMFFLKWIGEIK
jgi:hypothetical protein